LNQFLAEAAATKQKIVASLNHLQAELGQLNGQIAEQRQVRERLSQEINALTQQKQKLAASSKSLKAEVDELERCRIEVDQYLAYVETKKKELETGANPLQKALKQLQGQVTALQEELRQLEAQVTAKRQEKEVLDRAIATSQPTQNQARSLQETLQKLENKIADRRQEKESLERQITQLQAQKTALRNQPEATPPELVRPTPPKKASASPPVADRGNGKAAPSLNPKGMAASQQAALPLPREEEEETQDLSDLWTDFMVQLSDYEFQALRAIAEEGSPLPILTQLAEESFTSTDELVDAINQRAQEILGEAIIKPQTGFSPPTIVRNQQRTIRKMIETYEYLTE
jgi:DNA repair exonuclease SbcCD ATPase subunit